MSEPRDVDDPFEISCDRLPAMLVALHGGRPELDPGTLTRTRFHIASCRACSVEGGRPGEPPWCPELGLLPLALVRNGDLTVEALAGWGSDAEETREAIRDGLELVGPGEARRIVEHAEDERERCELCHAWRPVILAGWDEHAEAPAPVLAAAPAPRSRSRLEVLARTGNLGPALATLEGQLRDVQQAARGGLAAAVETLAEKLAAGCADLEAIGPRRPETIDLLTEDDEGRLSKLVTALGEHVRAAADAAGVSVQAAENLRSAAYSLVDLVRDHDRPRDPDARERSWHAVALVTAGSQGLLLPWQVRPRGIGDPPPSPLGEDVGRQLQLVGQALLELDPTLSTRLQSTWLDPGITRADFPGVDGPSAGAASFVTLCACLTRIPALRRIAYTGEVVHAGGAQAAAHPDPREILRVYGLKRVGGAREKARGVVESGTFIDLLLVPKGQATEAKVGIAEGRAAVARLHAAVGETVRPEDVSARLQVVEAGDLADVLDHAFGDRMTDVLAALCGVAGAGVRTPGQRSGPAVLADLYEVETGARLMAKRAGVPGSALPAWTKATDWWQQVWELVEKGEAPHDPGALLREAQKTYERNAELVAAIAAQEVGRRRRAPADDERRRRAAQETERQGGSQERRPPPVPFPTTGGPPMNPTFKQLRDLGLLDVLAQVFNSQALADDLLDEIDFPIELRPPFVNSKAFWRTVCLASDNGATEGRLGALLAAAARHKLGLHNPAFDAWRGTRAASAEPRPTPSRPPAPPTAPLVLVAAAPADAEWTRALREYLRPFELQGLLVVWSGETTVANIGAHRLESLASALAQARIAVPVLSVSFLGDQELCGRVVPDLVARRVPILPLPATACTMAAVPPSIRSLHPATPWDRPLAALTAAERGRVLAELAERIVTILAG